MRRAIWPVLVAATIGIGILLSLGAWQIQRLSEKQKMIAEMDQRMTADPLPFTEALSLANVEAVKVMVTGQFTPAHALRKIAVLRGGPGFEILSPFIAGDGTPILVQRGIAGEGQSANAPRGNVTLTGMLRLHSKGQGSFDGNNNATYNQWNWWDVAAMYKAAGLRAPAKQGLILELLPKTSGTETLFVAPPKVKLRNNHLGYAITWFGLAAVLMAMAGAFVWRLRQDQKLA